MRNPSWPRSGFAGWMREAASDVCSIAHERAATKQAAGKAAAHAGFDDMAPAAALLALRICTSYSTRLAPCIRGHLVRNAAHEGFRISLPHVRLDVDPLLVRLEVRCDGCIAVHTAAAIRAGATREEVAEALGTAAAVNAGAALVFSARVMDAYAAKAA